MPLRVKLKADERVIINGALISARQTTALVIHNRVSLLRERQILPPASGDISGPTDLLRDPVCLCR